MKIKKRIILSFTLIAFTLNVTGCAINNESGQLMNNRNKHIQKEIPGKSLNNLESSTMITGATIVVGALALVFGAAWFGLGAIH